MRLKTMNKRINQARLDMSIVLGEFKIKLDTYLRRNLDFTCYSEVDCNGVRITSNDFLTDDMIEDIEDKFLVFLNTYEPTFSKSKHVVQVLYFFHHKKEV